MDFDLHRSKLVVLLGPSSSGTSTLLNILGGLDAPTSGDLGVRSGSARPLAKQGARGQGSRLDIEQARAALEMFAPGTRERAHFDVTSPV